MLLGKLDAQEKLRNGYSINNVWNAVKGFIMELSRVLYKHRNPILQETQPHNSKETQDNKQEISKLFSHTKSKYQKSV